jgi:hypothetical protein
MIKKMKMCYGVGLGFLNDFGFYGFEMLEDLEEFYI